jgi:hypothetical protein
VFDAMIEKGRQLNSLAAGALESLPENARGSNMENGDAGAQLLCKPYTAGDAVGHATGPLSGSWVFS